MKYKTEALLTWLEQALLTVINMKINGAIQKRNQQKSIDETSTGH